MRAGIVGVLILVGLGAALADEDTGAASAVEAEALLEADQALLDRYVLEAAAVVVGEVVAVRTSWASGGQEEIATLLIEEQLVGNSVGLVEFRVPLLGHSGRPVLIEGYRLLVFLDRGGSLLDGEALFFVEGGFAWRNRRDGVFLRPSVDREWGDEVDPLEDYIVLSLAEIRQRVNDSAQVGRKKWR